MQGKLQAAAAKMGANAVVSGPWWGRTVSPETGRVIVAVAIRYTP